MPTPKGPSHTGRFLWGPARVRRNLSIRELAELSGVNRGDLSRAENGLKVPTADQFEKVMAVLAPPAGEPAAAPLE